MKLRALYKEYLCSDGMGRDIGDEVTTRLEILPHDVAGLYVEPGLGEAMGTPAIGSTDTCGMGGYSDDPS